MKYCVLMFALLTVIAYSESVRAQDDPHARWEKTIRAFEKEDASSFPEQGAILFIGSSSFRMWSTLAEDMAPFPVVNRGFGGSHIDNCTRFADRIAIPYRPSAVVLYAGDNDIAAKKSPDRVLEDFKSFVSVVHASLPGIPIYFASIKPSPRRWEMWEDMKRANALIERYCVDTSYLAYVDVSTPMLDETGIVRGDLYLDDNLHMNADGYRLWTSIIKPRLEAYRKDE